MDFRKLIQTLMSVGGVAILGALGWWFYFYSQVAKELKVDLGELISCVYSTGGSCGVVSGLAKFAGYTPYEPMLLWFGAATYGIAWILKSSLKESASETISTQPNDIEKRLIDSAASGNCEEAQKCIELGVNLNAANQYGATALHLAALHGHEEVVKALLQSGADRSIQNKAGKTAIQLCEENGHHEIANLLRS